MQPFVDALVGMANQLQQAVGALMNGNQAFLQGLAAERAAGAEAHLAAQHKLAHAIVERGAAHAQDFARLQQELLVRQQETARIAEVKLPDFKADGSLTYSAWFTRVATLTEDFGERRVQRVLAAVQGRALDIITARGLPARLRDEHWDWARLARELRQIFEPKESLLQREERFRKLHYSTSGGLDGYVTKFLDMLAERDCSDVPDDAKIRYFLVGLSSGTDAGIRYVASCLLVAVETGEINTVDGLLRKVEALRVHAHAPAPAQGGAVATPMEVNRVRSMTQPARTARGGGQHRADGKRRPDGPKCYNCRNYGHIAKDCNMPRRPRKGERNYAVEVDGVDDDDVVDDDQAGQAPSAPAAAVNKRAYSPPPADACDAPSMQEQGGGGEPVDVVVIEGDNKYVYTGRLHGGKAGWTTVRVLVDSGARRNMISARLAQRMLRENFAEGRNTLFKFANGTTYTSTQRCPATQLRIGQYATRLDLLVCALADVDVILGKEWLQTERPQNDWGTGTITLAGAEPFDVDDDPEWEQALIPRAAPIARDSAAVRVEVVNADRMRRTLRKLGTLDGAATMVPKCVEEIASVFGVGADTGTGQTQRYREQYAELFQEPTSKPPPRARADHKILLQPDAHPPFRNPFRLSHEESGERTKQLEALLSKDLIRPSASPYGAPVLFARKKDGTLRLCIDYRLLNKVTVRDRYPLPDIAELLDRLAGAKVFSKLDLRSGYHQVRMAEGDVEKTAFTTHLGAFEWLVMPMGLPTAPATFQRLMNDVLRPFHAFARVYLDDIVIFSASEEEHEAHVRQVLDALRRNQLRLNPSKCVFHVTTINFLGHAVSPGRVSMEPDKVEAVRAWTLPRTKKQLQSLLGLNNFYRKFVQIFARFAAPLTDLLHDRPENAPLGELPEVAVGAFQTLKTAMTSAPVLHLADVRRPIVVFTDASFSAVGAVLHQRLGDGTEVPVAYMSKRLSGPQSRYDTRDRQCLAVVTALEHWRHYLLGCKFELYLDHESLQWLESADVLE